jgi:acyl-CoA synthetase (AMP-forming)/AMP-acid ligase II
MFSSLLNGIDGQQPVAFDKMGKVTTWDNYKAAIFDLAHQLKRQRDQSYALWFEKPTNFLVALFAVIESSKIPVLLPNNQEGTLERLKDTYDQRLDPTVVSESLAKVSEKFTFSDQSKLLFFTSGSTGAPKRVTRSLHSLLKEITAIEDFLKPQVTNSQIQSTVSHQHIYGLIFRLLWPLMTERSFSEENVLYTEELELLDEPFTLISSPAFLRRLDLVKPLRVPARAVISSGGPLCFEDSSKAYKFLGARPLEILGSTETGGFASRIQNSAEEFANPWTLLKDVKLECDTTQAKSESYVLRSEFFDESYQALAEKIELVNSNQFHLKGRYDRIVKFEEKRISLDALEEDLKRHPFVKDTKILFVEEKRHRLLCVCILSSSGHKFLNSHSKLKIKNELNNHLLNFYENSCIPKHYRFVEEFPRNSQDKVEYEELIKLFVDDVSSKEPTVLSVETSEGRVYLKLFVPKDLYYFRGHFPDFSLLPGVVQIHWVVHFSKLYLLKSQLSFKSLTNVKFMRPILPETYFNLKIQYLSQQLRFEYSSEQQLFSKGSIDFS